MQLNITTKCEKCDSRRLKEYAKRVFIIVENVEEISTSETQSSYSGERFFATKFLEDLLRAKLTDCNVSVENPYYVRGKNWTVSVRRVFPADKPSNIISDEEAVAQMPTEETVKQAVLEAYAATVKAHAEHYQRLKDIDHASFVMQHRHNSLKEQAKKNVRLQQRLAALEAEFKAEFEVLCEGVTADLVKELKQDEDDGKPRWSDGCVALVKEHMDAYLKEHTPAAVEHGFLPRAAFNRDAWLTKRLKKDENEQAA